MIKKGVALSLLLPLFRFMVENPDSATTRGFIEYHREMNDPKTQKGNADFTYLIGKEFIAEYWADAEDLEAFQAYVEKWDWDQ